MKNIIKKVFIILLFIAGLAPAVAFAQQEPVWTRKDVQTSPMADFFAVSAYDIANQEKVLFGGSFNHSFNFSPMLDQTWTWNGSLWQQRFPLTSPLPRYRHAMSYDQPGQKIVLFGGLNAPSIEYSQPTILSDTWVWNGQNWEQKFSSSTPLGRYDHALAYDEVNNKTVLFGGIGIGNFLGDTWLWDGQNWQQQFPTASPGPRFEHAMTYDKERNQTVLFGGQDQSGAFRNDTWVWNGTNWVQQFPVHGPEARRRHAMVYDTKMKKAVLFGGDGPGQGFADTWFWDGTDWSQVFATTSPNISVGGAMAYDQVRSETVLYGSSPNRSRETWVFGIPEPPGKRPVLIIPGILGTELYNGNDLIWADLAQMFDNLGDNFLTNNLSLNEQGASIQEITIGNVIDQLDLSLFNIPRTVIDIFKSLGESLETDGYLLNQSYFFFPYDWRLDLDVSKQLLQQKIQEIKGQTSFQKIDVVTHSLGGLLAEDYIQEFGGNDISKLIFVGTPHIGAPKAGKVLLEGDRFGIPWLEEDRMKELGKNSIALHELLPTQKYFGQFTGYIKPYKLFGSSQPYDYSQTKDFLLSKGSSQIVFSNAEDFFAKNLQDLDLSGIDAYNIAGCKSDTQSGYQLGIFGEIASVKKTSGDETVPLVSADYINIPADHKWYIRNGKHAELPSTNGVRELITDILFGGPIIITDSDVSNNSSFCNFKGKELLWRSPVEVHIFDNQNNHTGPIENNGIEYGINGVSYDIINGHTFVFLPTDNGQTYNIVAKGLEQGTFDLLISQNDNGDILNTNVFNDVAIIASSTIQFDISEQSNDSAIQLDENGTGNFQEIPINAQVNGDQSNDLTPPQTTATVTGTQGSNNWYTSDAAITLQAVDDSSGVLQTFYSTDNGVTFNEYTGQIMITSEGTSNLEFYSVDNMGNNEIVQQLQVQVDKTTPEISAEFSLTSKNFTFTVTDNIDPAPTINCIATNCTAEDQAGNTTVLGFRKNNVSSLYTLNLTSLAYNDVNTPLPDNLFAAKLIEKNSVLVDFDQALLIDKQQILAVDYDKKKNQSTVVTLQKDGTFSKQVVVGMKFLQLKTDKGTIKASIH